MEQDHQPLALVLCSNQWRAVGEVGPNPVWQVGVRFGQNLAAHLHGFIEDQAVEGTGWRKGLQALRRFPAQRAAQRASAFAQLHRYEIVSGSRHARSGKTQQQATALDPLADHVARILRQNADVGQHQHGEALIELVLQGLGVDWLGHLTEGFKSPRHIIERREQRLGRLAGGARLECDGFATPAVVHEEGGGGVALGLDGDAVDVVAQFDGQFDYRFGLCRIDGEIHRGLAECPAIAGMGHHLNALRRSAFDAQHRDFDLATFEARSGQRQRQGRLFWNDGLDRRLAARQRGQAGGEGHGAAVVDAVAQPDDAQA